MDVLFQHAEDSTDHNLPMMEWYAFEPLVAKDVQRASTIAKRAKISKILAFTVQRLADIKTAEGKKALADLTAAMKKPVHHHTTTK